MSELAGYQEELRKTQAELRETQAGLAVQPNDEELKQLESDLKVGQH
jgi:hypothetical protein